MRKKFAGSMCVALAAIIFGVALCRSVSAQVTATPSSLKGITEKAEVVRDDRHVPYIRAENQHDVYFVQGYVTASDRLWQMDLMRRVARGETAEIFGGVALEQDKLWRTYGFSGIVKETAKQLRPDIRNALESYAAGVNAYIDSLKDDSLPVEFKILKYKPRRWEITDTLVIGKILAEALSSTWRMDLLKEELQSLPKEKQADLLNVVTPYDVIWFGSDAKKAAAGSVGEAGPIGTDVFAEADRLAEVRQHSLELVGLYAEDLAASNNWVIAGSRTADGVPILANDPHLQPSAPGIWYMAELSAPGLHVAGVALPGVPGIILGHNDKIAWGATNVGPDVQDVYMETSDAQGRFKTKDGWAEPTIRHEVIKVRKNIFSAETRNETLDVTETANGVVILEQGDKKYSLKWTARDPKNNDFGAFFRLNRAGDWAGFKASLANYAGASQNFVFADKAHIGWHIAGAIPIRRKGDGSLPYDGASSDGDWVGTIPFDELPNRFDPPEGFIVTANQRTVGTDYKYPQLVRAIALPWRARRLYDRISAERKATMDGVGEIQRDAYNIPLAELSKIIVAKKAASATTLAELGSWDGTMNPDSNAALRINEIRNCLGEKIAFANAPAPAPLIRETILLKALQENSKLWLPPAFSDYNSLIRACDTEADTSLAKRFGKDPLGWTWGKAWVSRFSHPLAAAPLIGAQFATPVVPLAGSGQTPNTGSYVSMRFVASAGNWDNTRLAIPLGESGDPRSPFYKDQFERWRLGNRMTFPFSKAAVEGAAAEKTVYSP